VVQSDKATMEVSGIVAEHECDVAVIGGGVAGGCAALAFARQGCSVRLFERRDLARDPNRGDLLHPPTVEIVSRLGLLGALEAHGAISLKGVSTIDAGGAFSFDTEVQGSRILNHAELESAFIEAAEAAGAVVQADAARSIVREGDGPEAGWLVETDQGTTRARFLVGADGADSLTRRSLGIKHSDLHEYDNWIVVLHGDCPDWLDPEQGWQVLNPDGVVYILPTTPLGRVRLVILIRSSEARDWMTSSEDELAHRLGERHPALAELKLTKRGGSHVYRLKRSHAERYSGPRVALAGDAAHTIHSMGGQGLNIAIQDSAKLAELVGPVLVDAAAGEVELEAALSEYEAIRRPINTEAIERADRAQLWAKPGQEAYELALSFFSQAVSDPNYVSLKRERFGGRES
jgi:2-polyprenyl-6-methoxyphenol hydroxylase-like FAD-dependent oxidoreductase